MVLGNYAKLSSQSNGGAMNCKFGGWMFESGSKYFVLSTMHLQCANVAYCRVGGLRDDFVRL